MGIKISHRGLFDNKNIPENSLLAIENSIKNGYPIELDIRITADKELVVFHDKIIERMTGYFETIEHLDYLKLSQYTLLETNEKIPKLSTILRKYENVELYIEIKESRYHMEILNKVSTLLKKHNNTKSKVISFIPFYIEYFKKINSVNKTGLSFANHSLVKAQMFISNIASSADFFLCEIEALHKLKTKKEVVAWTVKNAKDEEIALKYADKYIFEQY